jgi:hypothetical protein
VQGKKFNWNRPTCDCGCKKVWGHGFVARFFTGFLDALFLKRYRCPECRRVFILLPAGYGRRIQTVISEVWNAIESRLQTHEWPHGLPRQRGGHWLKRFLIHCRMNFAEEEPLSVLARLRSNGIHLF